MTACKNCRAGFILPIPYEKANELRDYCPDCVAKLSAEGRLEEVVRDLPVIITPLETTAEQVPAPGLSRVGRALRLGDFT